MKKLFTMVAICLGFVFPLFVSAQGGGAGGRMFVQEYVYDFAKQGGAVGFISLVTPANPLPIGAVVTSVHYRMVTAFTSGGSATVAIGDQSAGAVYRSALAFDNAAYALDNVAAGSGIPNLIASANEGKVGITVATAALTAGKMVIFVEGYIPKQ